MPRLNTRSQTKVKTKHDAEMSGTAKPRLRDRRNVKNSKKGKSSTEESEAEDTDETYTPSTSKDDISFNKSFSDDTSHMSSDNPLNVQSQKKEATSVCGEKADDAKKHAESSSFFVYIIIFIITLGFAYFFCFPTMGEVKESRLSLYQESVREIAAAFPSQHPRLWKIIRLDMEKNLKLEDPHQPSVLMLASDEGGYASAQCLADKLAKAFSRKCQNHVVVGGSSLNGLPSDEAKLTIDQTITTAFKQGSCSAVVSHFEDIPSFSTNVFYQFCENDNAPYKNVSIIFTVQVQPVGADKSYEALSNLPAKWDKVVDDFLTRSLHDRDPKRMTHDKIGGLLSRTTQSVVWVAKEDNLGSC